jgi:hypothetical protein
MPMNKDMLTRQQRQLGASLIDNPTIIDPGTWWYGNIGAAEPSYEVEDNQFVDAVPKYTWTKFAESDRGVLLTEPSPQNAVLLIPAWGDGFERLKLMVRPYFALLWENATRNTRIHIAKAHVGKWDDNVVLIAEEYYSESAKRSVPWSMYTTGSTEVARDAEVES